MVVTRELEEGHDAQFTRPSRRRRAPLSKRTARLTFERLETKRLLSLTHQYTFNNGSANDSVGGANGMLVHGATIVDGWLTLNNLSVDTTTGAITNITSGSATAQYAQ